MQAPLTLLAELSLHEGADVEYKSARGGLPASLWETYSAFANTDGGTLWLGIRQVDDALEFQGVAEPERMLQDFWNTVNNRSKVNINLLRPGDAQIIRPESAAGALICIQVPRALRHQRPVYVGLDPMRGTFRRHFEGDYLCNEAEVKRMFADQSDEPADSRILDGFGMGDVHLELLRQFRNLFGSRQTHAWLAEDDAGLLTKLGGWRRDRRSGQEGLTLAGLLMFGRHEAIRDPAGVPGFHLDYRERFSDEPAARWTDRLTPDGTWEANLFQFYQQVMLKLSTGPGIKRPFQTDASGLRSGGTPVTDALQEALVNALIHADHLGQGGIVIDRWLDRMEFSNPGTLLISREQLWQGGVSECRNKSLQLMFQMLGVGDKAGSGIDKIRSSWAAEHWQAPVLMEQHRPDRVMLELPMVSLLPEGVLDALRLQFGPALDRLNGDEVRAVVTARLEGQVTNRRLQGMLTLHSTDIGRMLGHLVNRQFLVSHGVGRGTRYVVTEPKTPQLGLVTPYVSPEAPYVSPEAPYVSAGSPYLGPGTPPLNDPVAQFENQTDLKESPGQMALRKVQKSQRTGPDTVRAAILYLCTDKFMSSQEIAGALGRNATRLQVRFLTPLFRSGLLRLRYPDKLNHPLQAYTHKPLDKREDPPS